MVRRGFTLVEVIVALLLLEVGLLGVVGTLVLASRTLVRAELRERGVGAVERVLDSLAQAGVASGEGRVPTGGGEVRWRVEGGAAHLTFATGIDSALVEIDGFLEGVGDTATGPPPAARTATGATPATPATSAGSAPPPLARPAPPAGARR